MQHEDFQKIVYSGIRPLQRLGVMTREWAYNSPLSVMAMPTRVPDDLLVMPPDPWPGDAQRGRDLVAGVFRLGGQTLTGASVSWRPPQATDAWLRELHGFEWLRDLRSVGGDRARRMARDMVSSWLDYCQRPEGIAWQPDVIGARVMSWIVFHDFFCASAQEDFREGYFAALTRQARYLSRLLPGRMKGLPLMRALKGLAYAGMTLEGHEDKLERAMQLIVNQVHEQILPDGTHISRSPQQTFQFLKCLVDLRATLIAARLELPDDVQHALDRIAPAVKFFRHPDGGLCHFNGSQAGNAHLYETTLMQSGAKGKAMPSLPHGGYARICMGRSTLIMDTDVSTAPRYAGETHAGMTSFEYTYGRDRVIVNCGSASVPGTWRDLLRSTAAHSAVTVDYANACPYDTRGMLTGRPDVFSRRQDESGLRVLEAGHNGYQSMYGIMTKRIVCLKDSGDTLLGEDRLTGRAGVPFAVRFHLHPSIQASVIQDGTDILLRGRSGLGWRFSARGRTLSLDESVYGGEGDTPRKTQQIVINAVTESADEFVGWSLVREKG